MQAKKIHINKLYLSEGKQKYCDVCYGGRIYRKIDINKVIGLIKNNGYICDNAIVVKGRYLRGSSEPLMKEEISKNKVVKAVAKATKEAVSGVYIKEDIAVATYEKLSSFTLVHTTKRYFYNYLLHKIKNYDVGKAKTEWQDIIINSVAIKGVRRIGKTTVLQQLYNVLQDVSYVDGGIFKGNIYMMCTELLKKGIKVILIDEVCKMSDSNKNALISYIKSVGKAQFFVLTGSVPSEVERIGASILDCEILSIQPIMYIERLAWQYKCSLTEAIKYSTNDLLEKYISSNDLTNEDVRLGYIQGIVEDTLQSYSASNYEDFVEALPKRDVKFLKSILNYVVLCQLVYITGIKQKKYIDVPMGVYSKTKDIQELIEEIKLRKKKFKNTEITAFCMMLKKAGLVQKVVAYDESSIKAMSEIEKLTGVEAFLFELPQFINVSLGTDVSESLLDMWLEYMILNKANYYYEAVGRYRRSDGTEEVDVVYDLTDESLLFSENEIGIIEVKRRKAGAIRMSKYDIVLPDVKTKEFVMTCTDVELQKRATLVRSDAYYMRNDIVVVLLEIAYCELLNKFGSSRRKTLVELHKQYFTKSK